MQDKTTQTNAPEPLLRRDEYYPVEQRKNQIVLHHTAGSHRPDWTIQGWNSDRLGRVATAYVIGSISTTDGNRDFDGRVLQTMNPAHWAHHLGIQAEQNERLNKASIGIELCCYGYVTKRRDGTFWSYVNRPVPAEQVIDLGFEFRGYRFWQSYTDAQLEAAQNLIRSLGERFGIPLTKKWSVSDFNVSRDALSGTAGVFTHCQYRTDKFDCYPHPKLIEMLNSL
jgi:N-acetyl-anhydromuramyl-L-alanine amidase AmpD